MRKNDAFVAKIVNTRLTKIFMAIFAPHERRHPEIMMKKNEMKRENRGVNEMVLQARVIKSACKVGKFVKVFVEQL